MLSESDLNYYKQQNTCFVDFLDKYFNFDNTDCTSDRQCAFQLVDAVTHYPHPHTESLKRMFVRQYQKSLERICATDIKKGIALWNLYNMSYVVKSADITVAFDLIRLPQSLRSEDNSDLINSLANDVVNQCDVLFLSHEHDDHCDPMVAKEFILKGKPVIANDKIFINEDFYDKIIHMPCDGKERLISVRDDSIKVRIYPGHQAITPTEAVDNNYTFITFSDGTTVADSGDQYWEQDFRWLDSIHKDIDTDVLITNTWTLNPDRVYDGIKPKIILPGHINEMGHNIANRIPFWQSADFWRNVESGLVHLFWGDTFSYERS